MADKTKIKENVAEDNLSIEDAINPKVAKKNACLSLRIIRVDIFSLFNLTLFESIIYTSKLILYLLT